MPQSKSSQPKRKLTVLGATGSIGVSTLDVIGHLGGAEAFEVVALTGMGNVALLAEQAKAVNARLAVTADESRHEELKERLAGTGIETAAGAAALVEAATRPTDWLMAGIVGVAGLAPTLAGAKQGATVALANKECLVSAGHLLIDAVSRAGGLLGRASEQHHESW